MFIVKKSFIITPIYGTYKLTCLNIEHFHLIQNPDMSIHILYTKMAEWILKKAFSDGWTEVFGTIFKSKNL